MCLWNPKNKMRTYKIMNRESKSTYDDTVTQLPTANELTDSYNDAYSWAIKLKDNSME